MGATFVESGKKIYWGPNVNSFPKSSVDTMILKARYHCKMDEKIRNAPTLHAGDRVIVNPSSVSGRVLRIGYGSYEHDARVVLDTDGIDRWVSIWDCSKVT